MLIAVDVDSTLYDTDRCTADILAEAIAKYAGNKGEMDDAARAAVDEYMEQAEGSVPRWFQPKYLIPEAIATLKRYQEEHTDIVYVILTKRDALHKCYEYLFKDTGLTFAAIYQARDYRSKAEACREEGIDILVDDAAENYFDHVGAQERWSDYDTRFILYTKHTTYNSASGQRALEQARYKMTDWAQFPELLETIKKDM